MSRKLHLILLLLAIIFAGISTVSQQLQFSYCSSAIVLYLLLKEDITSDFYTLLGIISFADTYIVGTIGVCFIFLIIATIKILALNKVPDRLTIIALLWCAFYFINESRYTTIGMCINSSVRLIYLFMFLLNFKMTKYDHRYATLVFIVSLIFNQIFSIALSPSLSELGGDMEFRLGEGDINNGKNNNLGGAMGFPVYTILIMCCSLPVLMGNIINNRWKIYIGIILFADFIISFYTGSKVYLLGLSSFLILSVFLFSQKQYRSKFIIVLKFFTAFIIILFILFHSLIDLAVYNYSLRLSNINNIVDFTTNRSLIYEDCFNYLINHPMRLFIGNGYYSYLNIGQLGHYYFSMSAHNVILDSIMAFGLIGTTMMILLMKKFYLKTKKMSFLRSQLLGWIPLICWIIMTFSNSPFMLFKTYVFLPYLIAHIVYSRRLIINEEVNS